MKNVSAWAAPWVEPEQDETDGPRNVTPGRVHHDDAWLDRKVAAFREDALARSVTAGRIAKGAALSTVVLGGIYCLNVPIVSGICFVGAIFSGAVTVWGWSDWRLGQVHAALDCTYED